MLNKGLLGDEVVECRGTDEEVISSFDFATSGFACCVRHGQCERIGIPSRSFWMSVPLPTPDGPEMTGGLRSRGGAAEG
jgi:hypothetical protein